MIPGHKRKLFNKTNYVPNYEPDPRPEDPLKKRK